MIVMWLFIIVVVLVVLVVVLVLVFIMYCFFVDFVEDCVFVFEDVFGDIVEFVFEVDIGLLLVLFVFDIVCVDLRGFVVMVGCGEFGVIIQVFVDEMLISFQYDGQCMIEMFVNECGEWVIIVDEFLLFGVIQLGLLMCMVNGQELCFEQVVVVFILEVLGLILLVIVGCLGEVSCVW